MLKKLISWIAALYICRVFLTSLTYKFTDAPETLHIFGTIGEWMKGIIGETLGQLFVDYGAYVTGVLELIASILFLIPLAFFIARRLGWKKKESDMRPYHAIGGLLSTVIMLGAITFHLITPLGIEVLHEGQSDGGSLFYAGVTIAILGIIIVFLNDKKLTFKNTEKIEKYRV